MMKKKFFIFTAFFSLIFLFSCSDKFDINRFDLGDQSGNVGGDTVYIPISPEWTGFNKPQDIIIGKEPFIYVADTENNRVVMMNLDGQVLGTRQIKRPIALAQDYKLNLLVIAEFDSLGNTYSAVYKLDLFAAQNQIENAPIERVLPKRSSEFRPELKYTAVCTFYDNSFYVGRTGPNNSNFVNPDNSILIFEPDSTGDDVVLIGRVPGIDPLSSGLVSANGISSLTSFNRQSIDFLVTLTGQNSFKTQWIIYVITPLEETYQSRFTPGDNVAFAEPNKFTLPEGTAIDNAGNIFVADAGTDSVYKFNSFGDELQSFGGPEVFNQPYAVAYFDQTLYVCDTGNDRILRFVLSTDIN